MNAWELPIIYLPLAWMGVVCTWLFFAVLARLRIDRAQLLGSLNINNEFSLAIAIYAAWTLVATVLLLLGLNGSTVASIGLSGNLTVVGVSLAFGGAVAGILLWPVVERITELFGVPMYRTPSFDSQQRSRATITESILLVTCGAIVVPLLEEIIFRGYALRAIQDHVGSRTAAILLVACAFASVHIAYGPGMIIYSFLLSLLLSALLFFSDNLYPAILMHALINLWAFVVVPVLARRNRSMHGD